MCHGYEWEQLKRAYEREAARQEREKAEQARGPAAPAPEPAPAPGRNEQPVPA